MSYLVLARKYRPQRFDELVGQEHIARTLTNAIAAKRVHHAFLFTGARGVGKTSAARILAKALCCAEGPTANPCGKCDPCREIAEGRSVDIMEIDGASNTGVDDVRTLREGARYMPTKGQRKIYIIDEVHMLSTSAFNALLKTLEEPPPHVIFIFATTEAHKIPTTILSRCQRYDFKLIPTARLTAHLETILANESIDTEPEALRLIARQAGGSVRDSLSLLDQVIAYVGDQRLTREVVAEVLGVADRRVLVELAGAVLDRDAGAALRILARSADVGVDLGQLARSFLGFLRDLEVVGRVADPADLVDATPDELEEARALARKATVAAGGAPGLLGVLFDRWARAIDEAAKSQSPRLLLEMALVDLAQAEPLEPLGDLLERLEGLEGRLGGSGAPPGGGGRRVVAGAVAAPRTVAAGVSAPPRSPGPASASTDMTGSANTSSRTTSVSTSTSASTSTPPLASGPGAAEETWKKIRGGFEERRPRIAALLAHAELGEVTAGRLSLFFPDRYGAEAAEKVRAEIEQAVAAGFGQVVRVVMSSREGAGGAAAAGIRSEVAAEADALAVDRKNREAEARQHPMIKKAQNLFGAALKEIKT
ncbi:MAG TPA: DNA polymerase III subunit gamma/tau [Polyangia bacterium]|nr:DNA polymerase III subunit gamma/tau [Polyangia bacterium]